MRRCDLLVMIGTDFPYEDFYPKKAAVIQIDRAATQIGKRHPVDVALVGNAGAALERLCTALSQRESTFLREAQASMAGWIEAQQSVESSVAEPIKPQRLVAEIASVAADDAIIVCDTGTVDAWTARHLRIRAEQRYTSSSALVSMGSLCLAAVAPGSAAIVDVQVDAEELIMRPKVTAGDAASFAVAKVREFVGG